MEELRPGEGFVWTIDIFSPLQLNEYFSDPFLIGGCKWRILATPKGNNLEFSYLYLGVANPKSCNSTWRSNVYLSFTIEEDNLSDLYIVKDSQLYFDEKSSTCCYPILDLPSKVLLVEDSGYLEKRNLTVVLRLLSHDFKATETLGESDNSRRIEENHGSKTNDLLSETEELKVNVNGFQVFHPQIGSVKRILERYPDIASEVCPKNQCLRTAYMNVILALIETLCQLPEELSNDDLEQATVALSFAAKGGFKVDWLEKKLEEVKEKKKKVDTGEARLQQIEEEMQQLNEKWLDLKILMDKENVNLSAAKVPLSFDDVV